jgi:hypothetical protein
LIKYKGFLSGFPRGNYNFYGAQDRILMVNQVNPESVHMLVICGQSQVFSQTNYDNNYSYNMDVCTSLRLAGETKN